MTAAPVIVASTYYPPVLGGAETAAAQIAEFLAASGRRVTVLTKRTSPDVPNAERVNGVDVVRLGPSGPRTAWGKWAFSPALAVELVRRRETHAAVICTDFRAIGVAALLARGRTGHAVILQAQTEGVISAGRPRAWLAKAGLAAPWLVDALLWPIVRLYDGGDAYPCISRRIEHETVAAGIARARIHYLPNPVDTRRFTPPSPEAKAALRAAAGIPADAKVAIVVGRLSREKGQLEALAAWAECTVPNGLLLLVGPDMVGHPWDTGPAARAFVAHRGLQSRVRFTGGVPAASVVDWLRLADVAVQPSHFEAFGTAAIEAMAAGLPVIASDVGGLRDFVEPGVNGLRVPVANQAAMTDAMMAVLGDDRRRATLAEGAARTAPRFDLTQVLGEFERVVDAAISRRRDLLT